MEKNNNIKRVVLIGDSTMQWIRPYRNHKDEFSYVEMLLKNENFDVDIYSMPNMISQDALSLVWKELQGKFYDYYIFAVGINDCSPRSYPKFFTTLFNNIVVPRNWFQNFLVKTCEKTTTPKIQKFLATLNLSHPWVSEKKFEEILNKIIFILEKETDTKIMFINIPPTTERVEEILQGINQNIIKYNEIYKKLEKENVHIIDMHKECKENQDIYLPEGIHYAASGHKLIYKKIISLLT